MSDVATALRVEEKRPKGTLGYYEDHGRAWAEREDDHDPNPFVRYIIDQMIMNPLFLDIGCGPARSVMALEQMGVSRYIGVDASETMIGVAKERFPNLDFRLGTMQNLKAVVPELCDGFFCVAALMQVPRVEVPQVLRSIRSVLQVGAVGYIATPSGTKSGFITHKSSNGRIPEWYEVLLEQWTMNELEVLLHTAGLEVVDPTVHETESRMLNITVRAF